jgi:hypothetical protein
MRINEHKCHLSLLQFNVHLNIVGTQLEFQKFYAVINR